MKEVIEYICEVIDEHGADLCDIDVLVRADEKGEIFHLSCKDCIFKVTEKIKYDGGCPYEWVNKDNLLK